MSILDLSSRNFVSIESNATLQYAAQLMKNRHVGGVVVCESNGINRPIGILTDRDIVLGVVAENLPPSTRVQDVMSKNIVTISKEAGLANVVDKMEHEGVRRMIIVDDSGSACGLITMDDVIQLLGQELSGLGKIVERQVMNEKIRRPQQSLLI